MTVVAIGAFVLCGMVPAAALAGWGPRALCLAPLLVGVVAAFSGEVAILTETALWPWALVALAAANTIGARRLRAVAGAQGRGRRRDGTEWVIVAAVATPLVLLVVPELSWDARSIWLLHGRWLWAGGAFFREAARNPAFVFSHSTYPPLISSVAALGWTLAGHVDLRLAQALVAVLNVGALGLIALGIAELAPRSPAWRRALVGSGAALGAVALSGRMVSNGYADLTWAAAAGAAIVSLLVLPAPRAPGGPRVEAARPALWAVGLLALLAAATTKDEGTVTALIVLGLAWSRHWRTDRGWTVVSVATALGIIAWPVMIRALGALEWTYPATITGPRSITGRFGPTLRALASTTHWLLLVTGGIALCIAALGAIGLRERRGLGSTLQIWIVTSGYLCALALSYITAKTDLAWHLDNSVDRTIIAAELFLLVDIAAWVALAGWPETRSAGATDRPTR